MYSTGWGRFPQTDPIGYTGGSNLYAYVGNDPLNLVDALGLAPDSPEATGGWVASAQDWLSSNASSIIGYGTIATGVAVGVTGAILAPETGGASLGVEPEAELLTSEGIASLSAESGLSGTALAQS